MFAYIPARGGSKRIPRKNARLLGGRPLIRHVLDALAAVQGLSGIAVSSDDEEILAIAQQAGAVTLEARSTELANDDATFMDLVRQDMVRFSAYFDDGDVLFSTATAALVPTEAFQQAVDLWGAAPGGLIMAVTEYPVSPFLALTGDPATGLAPLDKSKYLMPTKDLPMATADVGCFYAFNREQAAGGSMLLDLDPVRGIVLSSDVGIDLDTEADWARLEAAWLRKSI